MVNLELKEILERYINGNGCTESEYNSLVEKELVAAWNGELTTKGDQLLATKE